MLDQQTLKFFELLSNPSFSLLFLVLLAWSLVWKGVALWKSAQNSQKNWFIFFLIVNTFGILEIIYIFHFAKPKTPKNQ